jgi:hypothetical protein
MSEIRRVDRIIVVGLVALLVALLAWALVDRSPTGRADAAAGRARRPSPSAAALSGSSTTPLSPSPSTSAPPATTAASTTAATSVPPSTSSVPSTSVPPLAGPVTAVGDSIMLDIQPYLATDIPGAAIDGMVSRQFETGIGVVAAHRADGTLGSVLIVELGTNGTVTPVDFDAMMAAAVGVKRVVFVNVDVPRSWEAEDNAVLAAGVARYPGVAVLADWYTLSSGHPTWFTPDQVHLEPAGAQALAQLVTSDA